MSEKPKRGRHAHRPFALGEIRMLHGGGEHNHRLLLRHGQLGQGQGCEGGEDRHDLVHIHELGQGGDRARPIKPGVLDGEFDRAAKNATGRIDLLRREFGRRHEVALYIFAVLPPRGKATPMLMGSCANARPQAKARAPAAMTARTPFVFRVFMFPPPLFSPEGLIAP